MSDDEGKSEEGNSEGGATGSESTPAFAAPEGLDAKYLNADQTGFNPETLTADLGKLPDLTAKLAEHDSRLAQRPDEASAYDVKFPDDFKVEGLDDMEFKLKPDDPAMAGFKDIAHKMGLSQDEFQGLLGQLGNFMGAQELSTRAADAESYKALGGNSEKRIDAAVAWLDAKLGKDLAEALTKGPAGKRVEAVEKLMRTQGMAASPANGHDTKGATVDLTKDAYENLNALNEARE